MRAWSLGLWLAIAALRIVPGSGAIAAQNQAPGSPAAEAAEDKEACIRNLKVIYDAIQAYQFDHKDLPNWLSDLVPDYLSDANVLICPVCRRTGRTEQPPLADPKLACSYVFEFCPVPAGAARSGEAPHTRREWKRRQMGLLGSVVPMVRCRFHDPVLNLAFNGSIYESPMQWELLFTNRIRAAELSIRAIFGGDIAEEPVAPSTNTPAPELVRHDPSTVSHPVDLSRFYTSNLAQAWQGKPGDDLAALPKGLQHLGGVDFDIRGIVQLKGQSPALSAFPASAKGIPVHQRCQHLYFLHAACVSGKVEDGEQIGSYVVHLPNDQMTLDIPIYYGRSVLNWHQEKAESTPDKDLKVAWSGQNALSARGDRPIRLFMTAWNLAPGVEVDSLDFVSAERNAAPFLVAISFD
ncbi:MAG TPA: hypothetical protein VFE51_20720 [Verrucomicrobiae bacterium]|nr:hypothetical protein [Verrucomicrobiae bacterium]